MSTPYGPMIRRIRQARQMTLAEVSAQTGGDGPRISLNVLSCLERGTKRLMFDQAVELARVLGCAVTDFVPPPPLRWAPPQEDPLWAPESH